MNPFQGQRKSKRPRKVSSILSKHFLVPEIPGFAAAKVSVKADVVPSGPDSVHAEVVVPPASVDVEVARQVVDVDVPGNEGDALDVVLHVVQGSAGDTGEVLAEGSEADTVPLAPAVDVEEVQDPEAVVDQGVPDPEENDPGPGPSKTRWRKMTSSEEMSERLDAAVKDFQDGNFRSMRECAKHHQVARTTLRKLLQDPEAEFAGYGKRSQVFSRQEETLISAHIKERMLQGCGMDVLQVQCLMQDLLFAAIASNPARKSGHGSSIFLQSILSGAF